MLIKLSLEYYKGFYEEQSITFAIPEEDKEGSGLTLIVGPNNTGKTTIIESLLLNKDRKFKESDRHTNTNPKIVIESNSRKTTCTNIDNGSQIHIDQDLDVKFELIPSRRYWNTYSGNEWDVSQLLSQSSNQEIRNSTGLDTAAILKKINRNKEQKTILNNHLKKIIPHFTDWTIDTNDQGDYVKYQTATAAHQASLLGDGVISIFRICAHLVADANDYVLIIDEPELSLHPTAQKNLSRIISLSCKKRQVILCTHSPHFVNWNDLINGAKFIRLNKPNDEKCIISSLKNESDYTKFIKTNLTEYQKPQLLDYVAKETLFAESILFVEGQEDVGLIRKWLFENKIEHNFEIFGYGVASWANIKLFLKLAEDLGLKKVAALYDNGTDTSKEYEWAKKEFPEYHIAILPTEDIRDKPTSTNKPAKIGCFTSSGILKEDRKMDFENILQNIICYFK